MMENILTFFILVIIAILVATDLYRILINPKWFVAMLKASPFGSILIPLILVIIWFIVFG